jgi:lipopolysaccharide/colanic/teichoic acid biosynthesis glycosyltransferase
LITKRLLDLLFSVAALLLLAPLFVLIAAWIRIESSGPAFFRQERVGRGGRLFRIHKFRTMRPQVDAKAVWLTVGADPRITSAGAFLRKYKIDELPQLIDVFLGRMSLVGPRPEVPRYVARYPANTRDLVLSVRPGITDNASIEFFEEGRLLAESDDPEKTYLEEILPRKLELYTRYVRERSTTGDLLIIVRTISRVFDLE